LYWVGKACNTKEEKEDPIQKKKKRSGYAARLMPENLSLRRPEKIATTHNSHVSLSVNR